MSGWDTLHLIVGDNADKSGIGPNWLCSLHGMEKVLMVVSRFDPCHADTGVLLCLFSRY